MTSYRLEVLVNGAWIVAAVGLSHAQAMQESLEFTRFKILQEVLP